MLGTIVNSITIIIGSLLGILITRFSGGMKESLRDTVMKGLGLSIVLVGTTAAIKVENMMVVIFSMALGAVVGELVDIDAALTRLGDKLENVTKGKYGRVSEGFVTATLVFCIGAMAVVGSLESGISGNHEILYAKAVIDGVTAIVFASSLGIGVMFSAVAVFLYQGSITLAASSLQGVLITNVITNMSAAGGLLIIAIGFNMLGITKIKVANLLPAIVFPIIFSLIGRIPFVNSVISGLPL